MRRSALRSDGFTLVELLIAMIIIGGALLGLVGLQAKALGTVNLSKQREQAIALTDRTMEQMRALPYDTVTAGLNTNDLGGDTNISSGRLVIAANSINEALVYSTSASVAPLYPHAPPPVIFTNASYYIKSYVTLASTVADDTSKGYWLTVVVSWSSSASGGNVKTVSTRSQLFSPTGCLATSTHPFSGPCQAFYDGSAGSTTAGISVTTGGPTGSTPVTGNPLIRTNVDAPSLSTDVQSEQTVSTQGVATTSGAGYSVGAGADTTVGGAQASTGASTDPTTGDSNPKDLTVPQSGTSLGQIPGSSPATFQLQAADGGATSASTTSAQPSGSCTFNGVPIGSGQACTSNRANPTGSMSAALTYDGGSIPLASMAVATTPNLLNAFVARYLSSTTAYCTGTSSTGCISANSSRSIASAAVGGLPSGATLVGPGPATGGSLVTVSTYTDSAKAESGPGAQPAAATRSGTVSYWNGSASVPLSLTVAGVTAIAPVTATYGSGTKILMSGNVTVGLPGSTTTGVTPCQPDPCTLSSSSGSVVASITYDIRTAANAQVGLFIVRLDLGSAVAKTSYRAAPNA